MALFNIHKNILQFYDKINISKNLKQPFKEYEMNNVLEKEVDSFKPEKEFFIIDSNNLKSIETSFYGFCIQNSIIVENVNDLDEEKLDGNCTYIYIKNDGNKITIKQDYIGSYGIYLYKNEDYFALSNSFQYLVDYIKKLYPISFNQDYANALFMTGLCSLSYSETTINEISLIDRYATIEIDIENKKLSYSYTNYQENTVEPDSEEGLNIIDNWYNNWVTLIKSYSKNNMMFDLSGGFDSRLTFLLLLGSEINHDSVLLRSGTESYCKEDLEIATEIANHYNFVLNNDAVLQKHNPQYSVKDMQNISFYLKLGFHHKMYPKNTCGFYKISGAFGGMLRKFQEQTEEEFINETLERGNNILKKVPKNLLERLNVSTKKVMKKSFQQIRDTYKMCNNDVDEESIAKLLYKETRRRFHFGKSNVESYLMGIVPITPLSDPNLAKLKTFSHNCKDPNLLISIIFTRYSELLNFKVEGGRYIDEKTIEYAKSVNNNSPYVKKEFKLIETTEKNQSNHSCPNKSHSNDYIHNLMVSIYHSKPFKNLFRKLYGFRMYDRINKFIKRQKKHPLMFVYIATSIYKALQDVETSKTIVNNDIVKQLTK